MPVPSIPRRGGRCRLFYHPPLRIHSTTGTHLPRDPGSTNVPVGVPAAHAPAGRGLRAPPFRGTAAPASWTSPASFDRGQVFCFIGNCHCRLELPWFKFWTLRRVLVPVSGRFSQSWPRWPRSSTGRQRLDAPPPAPRPLAIETALRATRGPRIKPCYLSRRETATASRASSPPYAGQSTGAGHPALFVVDAIASLADEPFTMDDWPSTRRSPRPRRA
jgi:alanine-glyoxylate transaminase/serine-glyoxylate transaminase/serine-pyruvate transaminase